MSLLGGKMLIFISISKSFGEDSLVVSRMPCVKTHPRRYTFVQNVEVLVAHDSNTAVSSWL